MCRRVTLVAAVALVSAAAWAVPAGSPVTVSVIDNAPDRLVVQYQIGDFSQSAVKIDGAPYLTLDLPHEGRLLIAGAPELPHAARSVIIPDVGDVTVNVLDAAYYELTDVAVAPSKGNLLRTVNPDDVPYEFDAAVYGDDAFFPGDLAIVGEPYILRDLRGVVVDVYPFQYNPVRRTLRVYTNVTVQVVTAGSAGVNALGAGRPKQDLSLAFDEIYQSHFINYVSPTRYAPLNETGALLIICHDPWLSNVQPLVEHRNSIGIPTTAVGVATIGNNANAIKAYIQTRYNQGGLAFVLLVGDAAQVATPNASGGSSDSSYSKLAGSDNYPDILVGRFSAETAAQVDTQVTRTIGYETLPATTQDWYWKGVGIASAQGAGQGDDGEADYVHIGNIRTQLLAHGYTYIDQIYDTTGGTAAMVRTALNSGRGIVNYCGHGSSTSWGSTGFSNSDVATLTNENLLPFIFSVACVNGQFAGQTCFGEAWLRATHSGQPTGAVGTYMSSINQSWAPPMQAQDEFGTLISNQTYHSLGGLFYASSCSMMDQYGSDGVEMFNTWIIFGDPSLRVIGTVEPPHGIDVTPDATLSGQGNYGGPFTPNSVSYTVLNKGVDPVPYEVTTSANWLTVTNASGTLAGNGSVVVTVAYGAAATTLPNGDYDATVNFANTLDHEGDATRGVHLRVGIPNVQFSWPLDTNPGWITEGQWQFGQPLGQGTHLHDPSAGHTGNNVYGYNLAGDYANGMGQYFLTTTPINCANLSAVELRFWRWLGVEGSQYDHATIDVSGNGSTWVNIWQNGATTLSENGWIQQTFNIAAIADSQAAVRIRWGMGPTDVGVTYPGWNIDDIEIWGVAASPTFCRGDCDCDGAVAFSDIDYFVAAIPNNQAAWQAYYAARHGGNQPPCSFQACDANGDGSVDFADIDPFVALIPSTCP